MIEAGARALCESRYLGAIAWEKLTETEREEFRADARACLAAVGVL